MPRIPTSLMPQLQLRKQQLQHQPAPLTIKWPPQGTTKWTPGGRRLLPALQTTWLVGNQPKFHPSNPANEGTGSKTDAGRVDGAPLVTAPGDGLEIQIVATG